MVLMPESGAEPWDQLPGEPDLWFGRFFIFQNLPPDERSMLAVYNRVGRKRTRPGTPAHAVPHRWRFATRQWRWVERAAAWDRAQRDRTRIEYEADREAARAERIAILRAGLQRLEDAISKLDPNTATWSDVSNGLRVICQEFRAEEMEAKSGKSTDDNWSELLDVESARAELAARLDAIAERRQERVKDTAGRLPNEND
jgi:hypothetical protein